MKIVDLRSDTVTVPTEEMRLAMYKAEVGDDVYGEDPTVNKLEALSAAITGKEAALLITSGTMGNQIAAMTHTQKGDEIICEAQSHIFYYEVGGMACLANAQPRQIAAPMGILSASLIEPAIREDNVHLPRTGLICLENSHNRAGGTCYSLEGLAEIKALANRYKIPVHIDGARIFNAALAAGTTVAQIAQQADSIQMCLSKGLCAPVGSLLIGSKAFIDKARRYRKMLGGGMRQAGIIAAAGIVALTKMTERLTEDHENARYLAAALADIGFAVDMNSIQTNIVIFDTKPFGIKAAAFSEKMSEMGIKGSDFGEYKVRLVTHYGIEKADIAYAINTIEHIVKG